MAPRTDRTTRIPPGVVSPVTTNHAAKGSVFVNLREPATYVEDGGHSVIAEVVQILRARVGRELMAPRTDRTTRIPSDVASPVTTNHAAKGSVFVNL